LTTSGDGEEGEDEEDDDNDDLDDVGYFRSEETKVFCNQGQLFVDGSSSGDVIQGQLGDCWFLSALSVLGTDDKLLEQCFWKREEFREYGLYILRFFKDCSIMYVVIDDRLPARAKDGRLIFAGCKNPDELWVPLIEKAYAKLFGCYKSLIGGYTHYGLADMTGYCPRLVVMKEGFLGYSEKYTSDDIWKLLQRNTSWNSLMGCSIQPNPKEKNKVEADAGNGLHMGHAYSFLKIGEIEVTDDTNKGKKTIRLVKLRNPWGRGEWEGSFSDKSSERSKYGAEIEKIFNQGTREVEKMEQNSNDGTFLMPFDDWLKRFTSLFIAVNFPKSWCGKRTQGTFSAEQGGNRDAGTWISNPRFKFRLERELDMKEDEHREVFVGIYIKDSRLSLGFDYFTVTISVFFLYILLISVFHRILYMPTQLPSILSLKKN
jgi:calpain